MKIILTESQVKLLTLIKENEDVLNQFNSKINTLTNSLNKFYTNINFISLAELLNGEVDVKSLISKIEAMDNSRIEDSFLEKYNCASCEYLDRCGMGCFMQHDYKFREELDECVYKLTHRYIDDVRLRRRAKASIS